MQAARHCIRGLLCSVLMREAASHSQCLHQAGALATACGGAPHQACLSLQELQQRWPGAWGTTTTRRRFASVPPDVLAKEVEDINQLFAAARDEIEMAHEDAETTYFNESVAEAKKVVTACLARWEGLLARLDEEERGRLVRSMGLKMEQLKAEFSTVEKLHLEDH